MGRSQSKILSSLGLGKSQAPADSAGRAFFAVRSGSLDSISTALSLTTQQSRPARTNSLDSLLLQSGSSRSRVEDGRRYVLLETGSVSSSRTLTADAEQRGSESNLTRSLPAAIERRVQCNSPRESRRVKNSRNPDGFSDNFVTADDEREARMNPRKSVAMRPSGGNSSSQPNLPHSSTGKSSLKKTQLAKEKVEGTSFPEIPAGLLKLSPDELKELVTFTATTLQQSLQEKFVDTHQRLLDNRGRAGSREQDSPPAAPTAKHVRINEGHHRQVRQMTERGGCSECRQVRNKRRPRRERPTSMPPIYVRERGTCGDNPPDTTTINAEDDPRSLDPLQMTSQREECRYRGADSARTVPDCSSHDCRQTYESRPPLRKCHCECSSSRGRRKRAGRARASREYDADAVGDSHVDTSIDDNCPGLPENRIRRRQHRHHAHRHSVMCERCLEAGEDRHACRQRHRHRSPDEEVDAIFRDGDDPGFLTLDQLKTAGLLMKRGSGCGGSGGSTGAPSPPPLRHSESFSQPRNHKPRAKPARPGSFRLEEVPTQSICVSNFKELIYPVRSRTGRDSPATDMAVANLDLNSSEMSVPILDRDGRNSGTGGEGNLESHRKQSFTSSDTTLNNNPHASSTADASTVRHTYLHSHHHFHHIIHHSQS